MSRDALGLAFWAGTRKDAIAEAKAWAAAEPHVELVRVVKAVEVRPGRWDVFVTVQSKETTALTLGLVG